ncbi:MULTISPECIES: hypothetical protein [Spirulina sp. CCY15215]|nr:hypothetical protein [Spirulina major]
MVSKPSKLFLVTIPEFSDRNVHQITTNAIAQLQEQNPDNEE